MVRRGSTVRVRQRALQKPRKLGLLRKRSVTCGHPCRRYGARFGAFRRRTRYAICSGEGGDGVAACFGGEGVAEVGVERTPLKPAGLIDGQEAFDRALAAFGLAAEGACGR